MTGTRKKKKYEKFTEPPHAKLKELEETAGLTQYRVVLKRRWPDGSLQGCKTFHQMPPDQITTMPDWVPMEFGGGNFEVYVTSPLDSTETLFMWGFTLEGEPIVTQRTPKQDPNNPFGAQVNPGFQRPAFPHPQGFAGHPYQQQPGIAGYQNPYGQPNAWGQRPAPARDTRLEGQLEDLKRQNADLQRQMGEQRHQEEMRRMREDSSRQLNELKTGLDKQLDVMKHELKQSRKPVDGDSHQKQMFDMFTRSNEQQMSMMTAMMTRESEASREQVKVMKDQMLADIEFRKEMYDKINDSKDPKHAAAMLDIMGQQTASTMNLIQQAVTSGLLGGSDGDPPWYRAVSQGLEKLNEFGNNLLAAKQREAAMQGMQNIPQPSRPRFPPPRPGFGQPPQPGQAQPPRTVTPPQQAPDAGGPPPQPPSPPARVPGQSAMPPTQEVLEEEEGEETQVPPSLIVAIQRFVMAMQQDYQDSNHEHTRQVADMIYDFVIFMRNNEMMPPEWRGVFDDPAGTIGEFLRTMVMPVNPEMGSVSEEYLAELGENFKAIMEEESEEEPPDDEAPVETKPPLQAVPTPPASPDEDVIDADQEPDEDLTQDPDEEKTEEPDEQHPAEHVDTDGTEQ